MAQSVVSTLQSATANSYHPSLAMTQPLGMVILAKKIQNSVQLSTQDSTDLNPPHVIFKKTPRNQKTIRSSNNVIHRKRQISKVAKKKNPLNPKPILKTSKVHNSAPTTNNITLYKKKQKDKKVSQLIMEINQLNDTKIPFSRNRYIGQYSEIITQVQQKNLTMIRKRKEEIQYTKEKEALLSMRRKLEGNKIQIQNKEKYSNRQKNIEQGVQILIDENKIAETNEVIEKMRNTQKNIYSPICSPQSCRPSKKKRCFSEENETKIHRRNITPEEKTRRVTLVKKQKVVWHQNILANKKEKIKSNYKKLKNLEILNEKIKGINLKSKKCIKKKHKTPKGSTYGSAHNTPLHLDRPSTTKNMLKNQIALLKDKCSSLTPSNTIKSHTSLLLTQKAEFHNKANQMRNCPATNRNAAIVAYETNPKISTNKIKNPHKRNCVSLCEKENEDIKDIYKSQIKQKLLDFASKLEKAISNSSKVNNKQITLIQRRIRGTLARARAIKERKYYIGKQNCLDINAIELKMNQPFTLHEREALQNKKNEIEKERDNQLKILLLNNKEELSKLIAISQDCLRSFNQYAENLVQQRISTDNATSIISSSIENNTNTPSIEDPSTIYHKQVCELAKLLADHKITPEEHLNQLECLHLKWMKKVKVFGSPINECNDNDFLQLKKEEEEAHQMLARAMNIDVFAEINTVLQKSKSPENKSPLMLTNECTKNDGMDDHTPLKIVDDNSLVKELHQENMGLSKVEIVDYIANYAFEVLLDEMKSSMFPSRKEINKGFSTDIEYVEKYIEEIYSIVKQNLKTFEANITIPIQRSSLFLLGQLQNQDANYFNDIENIRSRPILPIEWYIDIEKRKNKPQNTALPEDLQMSEMINIHNKCIFDALNDAFDYYRPLGIKGTSFIWSTKVRGICNSFLNMLQILIEAKNKVLQWCRINAGCILSGNLLNPKGDEQRLRECTLASYYLSSIREERLAFILSEEINADEEGWVDYELEETQTKLDLADMILDGLLSETADILNNIENSRKK